MPSRSIAASFCVAAAAVMLAACQTAPPEAAAPQTTHGHWAERWQAFALPGKRATAYRAEQGNGRWVLHAQAERSASMYRRKLHVEPGRLGTLTFSWKVDSLVPGADVRDIDAEDAVVRVLLAFDGDHGRLNQRTRMMFDLMQELTGEKPPFATLMYVWDNRASAGSVVINPRTDRVRKIVVESGPQHLAQWRSYRRDIVADYRHAFGESPGALTAIAVMTDADNTQSRAEAWYGEVALQLTPTP